METLSAGEAQDMLDGLHYVNIHTDLHGGGEIRGQILQDSVIPTVSEWGLAVLALLTLAVGTLVYRRRSIQVAA